MTRTDPRLRPCGLLVLCLALAGCGPGDTGREVVSGHVTLKGKPLDQGMIRFLPLDNQGTENGAMIRDGEYRIDREQGLKPGRYKVLITSGEPGTVDPDQPPGPNQPVAKDRIPKEYNTESQQVVEVKKGGSNRFDYGVP